MSGDNLFSWMGWVLALSVIGVIGWLWGVIAIAVMTVLVCRRGGR